MFLAYYQNLFSAQSMSFVKALLIAIGGISFVTFFHELGHYVFARLFNVKVAEFSIGFGDVSWFPKFKDKNGTVWKFGPIPFGGYVGILTESTEDRVLMEDMGLVNFEKEVKQDVSEIKGIYLKDCNKFKTILISFSGPLFNLILSFFIVFFIVFRFGKPSLIVKYKNDTTHFLENDLISRINGVEPFNVYHFSYLLKQNNPKLTLIRKEYSIVETKLSSLEELKLANLEQKILPDRRGNFLESAAFSAQFTKIMSQVSIQNYAKLLFPFNRKEKLKISGPIGIIKSLINTIQKDEIAIFFHQIALISILIGIFNLIPIPPLDGGHILFTFIQIIFGKSTIMQNIFNRMGFFVTIFLIGITFFADLKNPVIRLVEFVIGATIGKFAKRKIDLRDKNCEFCSKNSDKAVSISGK